MIQLQYKSKGIPFDVHIPNEGTSKAIESGLAGRSLHTAASGELHGATKAFPDYWIDSPKVYEKIALQSGAIFSY